MSQPVESMLLSIDNPLFQRWWAMPNDIVGGWSICNAPKPPSMLDSRIGERELFMCIGADLAQHVVDLHNMGYQRIKEMYGSG